MTINDVVGDQITPRADAGRYAPLLNQAMQEYGIDTPVKKAAFLAQIATETGGLSQWSKNTPATGFNVGRGLIQLTLENNYAAAEAALGIPLHSNLGLASDPKYAFRIAAWCVTQQSNAMDTSATAGGDRCHALFHELFRTHLVPVQLRHGARLVGRWETDDSRVVAVWEYDDRESYERVQAPVVADPASRRAQAIRQGLPPLFTDIDEIFMKAAPERSEGAQ